MVAHKELRVWRFATCSTEGLLHVRIATARFARTHRSHVHGGRGLACGSDTPLTPAGTTDVDAVTPAATQAPMPIATATAVPTATATNTPVPTATATPVVPDGKSRTAPIPRGQSVTHDDFKLTITDVSYSTAGEGFFAELEEGHVWAYVSLRIESTGDPDKTRHTHTTPSISAW